MKVVKPDGTVLFTGQNIKDGQNVWQSLGGQEIGTVSGIFGFLINPPIALYYMQGLNTKPVHGHTALFGVYGMLGIGLMLFVLREMNIVFTILLSFGSNSQMRRDNNFCRLKVNLTGRQIIATFGGLHPPCTIPSSITGDRDWPDHK